MATSPAIRLEFKEFSSEQEDLAAIKFTYANLVYLNNLLVLSATEKINLPVDPENPIAFAYQSEFLRGQISILQEILSVAKPHT